jgi:hypothetical protein
MPRSNPIHSIPTGTTAGTKQTRTATTNYHHVATLCTTDLPQLCHPSRYASQLLLALITHHRQNLIFAMSDEILVPDSQPSDNDKGKGKAPARQPSALLIDAIAVAADVSSTSEDPPARLSNNKLPDLPWHGRFKPNPPTFIGNVGTNPPLPDIDLPHGKGGCSPYVDHLDTYETLFNELLKDELIESNVLERDVEIQLLITSHRILQAMDTRIIHCLVRGDLPIRYRKDRDVKCIIDTLWRSQDVPFGYPRDTAVQPAIYVQYLTDRDGVGLSAAQYTVLISRMRTYAGMKDPDYALKIDTFMPSQQATMKMIKNGRRKYLNRQLDTAPSAERVGWVIRFCDALEVRVKNEQGIERYPLREVGYSNSAQRRLHEHATHQSSNFLMNLAEVICGIEFPDRFHFDQYVVARLHAPQQAVLAEVLLTRLGSGRSTVSCILTGD